MKVNIEGLTGSHANELKMAAEFFATILVPGVLEHIILDIDVKYSYQSLGSCGNEDDDCKILPPSYFTIEIKKRTSINSMVATLAHEMVHLKQYVVGDLELKIIQGGYRYLWKGKVWEPDNSEHKYWDAPWEIEAYGREPGLYNKWIEHWNSLKTKS